MRYKLTIEYDGTDFHGWQLQPDLRTVQGEIEAAVARLVNETARVLAAGRTDAGVHACGQVVSFVLERPWSTNDLMRGLNAVTPDDLAIRAVEVVDDRFDPRRDAKSREYIYRIWNARWRSPFWRRYSLHEPRRLDVEAMREAAAQLVGEHDFTSFQAAGCDAEHAVRRIFASALQREEEMVTYRIEATAFLRHMVRNIIGTLVEVGLGVRKAGSVSELLAARDRTRAAATARPEGLCLTRVGYTRQEA